MENAIIVLLYVVAYIAIGIVFATVMYRIDKNVSQESMAVTFTVFWPALIVAILFLGVGVGINELVKRLSGRR